MDILSTAAERSRVDRLGVTLPALDPIEVQRQLLALEEAAQAFDTGNPDATRLFEEWSALSAALDPELAPA